MSKHPIRWLLLTTLGLSMPALSSAQPLSAWYIGAGLGRGEAEVIGHDRSQLIDQHLTSANLQPFTVMGSEHDNTDNWKLYAGYRIKPWLAAELSYHDLGYTTGSFAATVVTPAANIQGTLKSDYRAVAVAIVGQWQLFKQLSLFGKGGLHRWQHRFDLSGSGIDISDTERGNGLLYGVGAGLSLTPAVSLKVEWERLADIEDKDGLDIKTLSLQWDF